MNTVVSLTAHVSLSLLFLATVFAQTNSSQDSVHAVESHAVASTADGDSVRNRGLPRLGLSSGEQINYGRLALVGGGLLGLAVVHQFYVQKAWWSGYRGPFHFREDLKYALNLDKVGHFYMGTVTTQLARETLRWSGFSETRALWFGAVGSSLFQLYVEFQDGFSTLWGFDRVDAASGIGGAFVPVLKYYVPFFENIDLKASYLPSHAKSPESGPFKDQKRLLLTDYEGQTFWLCFKVRNLLPEALKPAWPRFLGLAVGMGVKHLDRGGERQIYLAFDYDLDALPGDSGFLKGLKEVLSFIHLPSPAVRISPSVIYYGLYFSR